MIILNLWDIFMLEEDLFMNKVVAFIIILLFMNGCTSNLNLEDKNIESAQPDSHIEYIITNEYYSDLLSDNEIKLLKENIVTVDVLTKVLGKIKNSKDEVIKPETYQYAGVGIGDYIYSYMDYSCKKYKKLEIINSGFYSKETGEFVNYIYKCAIKDENGETVPLFYKRIAPPSNINFEGFQKPPKKAPSENLDTYFTEEEIRFLSENFITVDTLEQVIGSIAYDESYGSGRITISYINKKGDTYSDVILIEQNDWNRKELDEGIFAYDIEALCIADKENGGIYLYLP